LRNKKKMLTSFIQIKYTEGKYALREIYLNTEHIVAMTNHILDSPVLNESNMPHNLDDRISFTKVFVNIGSESLEVIVIGTPDVIERRLFSSKKRLLRG